MTPDRSQTLFDRMESLWLAWLDSLRHSGWSGTPDELAGELGRLDAQRRSFALVPAARGVARSLERHQAAINTAGWQWTQRRTGKARIIEFAKVGRVKRKSHLQRG